MCDLREIDKEHKCRNSMSDCEVQWVSMVSPRKRKKSCFPLSANKCLGTKVRFRQTARKALEERRGL